MDDAPEAPLPSPYDFPSRPSPLANHDYRPRFSASKLLDHAIDGTVARSLEHSRQHVSIEHSLDHAFLSWIGILERLAAIDKDAEEHLSDQQSASSFTLSQHAENIATAESTVTQAEKIVADVSRELRRTKRRIRRDRLRWVEMDEKLSQAHQDSIARAKASERRAKWLRILSVVGALLSLLLGLILTYSRARSGSSLGNRSNPSTG